MIALGILLCLYAVGSAVLPLLGKQFGLLVWLEQLVLAAQWAFRGGVLAAGVALIALGWRARRGKPAGSGDGAGEEA